MMKLIVPFRDREKDLSLFHPYIKEILGKNNIEYQLIIVEQVPGKLFNRGKLFNIGFDIFHQDKNSYFCFHDVDLLPQNDECDYSYPEIPRHLVSQLSFDNGITEQIDSHWFGGVVLFNRNDFIKVNGFSNEYWGWGAEDDDLAKRLNFYNIPIERKKGHYRDIEIEKSSQYIAADKKRALNPHYAKNEARVWNEKYDYQSDGLSNLIYKIINKKEDKKMIRYFVEV